MSNTPDNPVLGDRVRVLYSNGTSEYLTIRNTALYEIQLSDGEWWPSEMLNRSRFGRATACEWYIYSVFPPGEPSGDSSPTSFATAVRTSFAATVRRPSWDEYGLAGAAWVATRADCSRRQVGALILDTEHRVVATGYNGSYPGGPSCLGGDCPRAQSDVPPGSSYDTGVGSCIAVHAEANALLFADRNRLPGATLYVTDAPCQGCEKLIMNTRLERVVYPDGYFFPHPR